MEPLKIRLRTRDRSLVAHVEMMPYKMLPEVVMWGDRFFRHDAYEMLMPIYSEIFCAPLVDLTHTQMWAKPLPE